MYLYSSGIITLILIVITNSSQTTSIPKLENDRPRIYIGDRQTTSTPKLRTKLPRIYIGDRQTTQTPKIRTHRPATQIGASSSNIDITIPLYIMTNKSEQVGLELNKNKDIDMDNIIRFMDKMMNEVYPKEYRRIADKSELFKKTNSEMILYAINEPKKSKQNIQYKKSTSTMIVTTEDVDVISNLPHKMIVKLSSEEEKMKRIELLQNNGYSRLLSDDLSPRFRRKFEYRPTLNSDNVLSSHMSKNMVISAKKNIRQQKKIEYKERINFLDNRVKEIEELEKKINEVVQISKDKNYTSNNKIKNIVLQKKLKSFEFKLKKNYIEMVGAMKNNSLFNGKESYAGKFSCIRECIPQQIIKNGGFKDYRSYGKFENEFKFKSIKQKILRNKSIFNIKNKFGFPKKVAFLKGAIIGIKVTSIGKRI